VDASVPANLGSATSGSAAEGAACRIPTVAKTRPSESTTPPDDGRVRVLGARRVRGPQSVRSVRLRNATVNRVSRCRRPITGRYSLSAISVHVVGDDRTVRSTRRTAKAPSSLSPGNLLLVSIRPIPLALMPLSSWFAESTIAQVVPSYIDEWSVSAGKLSTARSAQPADHPRGAASPRESLRRNRQTIRG